MAKTRAYLSLCWNSLLASKDELAAAALTVGNETLIPTLAMSRAPTSTLATIPTVTEYSDNGLFKHFMKAYLKAQVPA